MVNFSTKVSCNSLDLLITSKPENIIEVYQAESLAPTYDNNRIEFMLYQTFFMKLQAYRTYTVQIIIV